MSEHTYNMDVYLGNDRSHATADVTATHPTRTPNRKIEGRGCKLYTENSFVLLDLFKGLTKRNSAVVGQSDLRDRNMSESC
jgi:hypothetical protein